MVEKAEKGASRGGNSVEIAVYSNELRFKDKAGMWKIGGSA